MISNILKLGLRYHFVRRKESKIGTSIDLLIHQNKKVKFYLRKMLELNVMGMPNTNQ